MTDPLRTNVTIVGGGITGLSAAWYLQKAAIPYILLEKTGRFGGKIQTDHVDGPGGMPYVLERAGDAFLATQKPWATQLAYDLGLEDEILDTNDLSPSVYILKDGSLIPYPEGLQLIIPTNRDAFLASPLLSETGKQRVLNEASVPVSHDSGDESIANFVRRRMGQEAVEMLAEPMLSGIYSSHPEEQSLMATFPRYRQLVHHHGSLIGGMAEAQKARLEQANSQPANPSMARPKTAFVSFKDGTETLVKALVAGLTGAVRNRAGVEHLESSASDCYVLTLESGEQIEANSVVITPPATVAAKLLQPIAPDAAAGLAKLRVVSTGVIFVAFRRCDVNHPLNGFGVVIPRREKRSINAMTWMSSKFPLRAPADHVLLRLFFGGARTPEMMLKGDDEVLSVARRELRSILGINAEPLFHQIYRWRDAQPQYDVGHLDRIAKIESALPANLYIAGCPYRGVGIPDCVRQGQETAQKIIDSAQ